MAEAMAFIGLAAAVSGLLSLVGQVSKLSYGFLSDIRNASKSQKTYLQEISSLTETLLRIEQALELQELGVIRPSSILTTTLQDCQELLISMQTSLEKATQINNSRIEKLKSSFKWPFDEKEVKGVVETIHRYRDIFVAALASDTFVVSVATFRKVEDLNREKDHHRILEWLGNPGPPRSSSAILDSACPGTGQWFLAHKEYLEWRDGGVSFLWCYGKPGVGKTVITSIVLDNLNKLRRSAPASTIYHFCDFAERKVEKTVVILQRLLRQILYEANPAQLSLLERRREASASPSLKELSQLLLDVAQAKANVYLIIDALDELDDRKTFIPILRELAHIGIKVFVTSRDIPDIRDTFRAQRNIEIQASRADLESFVVNSFEDNDYCDSPNANSAIVSAIVDQAGGMFLLVQLLMKQLLGLTSIKQMRQALKSLPSNLADAYESSSRRILEQSPSRANLAMRAIGWIIHAERRLKVEELRHALAVEEHASEIDEENLTTIKVILQVCIGLVSVDPADGTITMLHVTAYDYFRRQEAQFSEIQLDMARTSMLYLGFHPLCDGACSDVEQLQSRYHDMPFLGYAAECWGDHARRVEPELSSQILHVLNSSGTRASLFQALQYRQVKSPALAVAMFESLPTGLEPLHVAAYWNLTSSAKLILEGRTDPSMPDAQGWTALHWASSRGWEEMVELLLGHKADIDAPDHALWTPLFWAAIKGHQRVVSLLLQGNANHLLTDTNGWTVLHWAASKCDTSITQILLDYHSEFKACQKPVQIAIRDVTVEHAKQLCKSAVAGSKALAATPLEIAADGRDIHTFNTILEELAIKGSEEGFNELWEQRGFDEPRVSLPWRVLTKTDHFDERSLRYLDIKKHGKGHETSADWKSKLLLGAIRDGKALIVQLLVELGADLQDCKLGRTPLHQAASLSDPEIAGILLANGANVLATTRKGKQSPLHLAIGYGFERTAQVLLQGGADVNAKNRHLKTPLMLACEVSSNNINTTPESIPIAMLKLLINHGADIHATNNLGRNAFHLTVTSHSPDIQIIQLLLQNGIDVHSLDFKGRNAIHMAAESSHADVQLISFLLQNGVDANLLDSDGFMPLHYLLVSGWGMEVNTFEKFDFLLARSGLGSENLECRYKIYGQDCETVDTPLSLAVKRGNWKAFHLLLAKGAILHTTTSLDDLMWKAACDVQPKAAEILFAQGASVTLTIGATPIGHRALMGLYTNPAVIPFDDFKSILKVYMDAGLDINATNDKNQSLLHVALAHAEEPLASVLVQHLIEVGVDVWQSVCGAWDAFLLATILGKFSVLRVLLAHAVEARNTEHWIDFEMLNHSCGDNDVDIICASLARENLINSKGFEEITPLQRAAELNNVIAASKLLSHGADLHARDKYGWTVLHTAVCQKDEAMVRLFLQAGIDVMAKTQQWGDHWVGLDLYPGTTWNGTALHLAAIVGQSTIAELLLQHGADANSGLDHYTERNGPTALRIALDMADYHDVHLSSEKLRVAEILVENGAKVNGVADHIGLDHVLRFEEFEELWEKLRGGITEHGQVYVSTS